MSRNLGTAQLVALVFVPLPFDFLAKFLKVLAEAAPGAAALNEGQSGEKQADTLSIVHLRVSTGRVMGENDYLTSRTFMAQGHSC